MLKKIKRQRQPIVRRNEIAEINCYVCYFRIRLTNSNFPKIWLFGSLIAINEAACL